MDNFWRRFKFFSIGLVLGTLLVFVFFGDRVACTAYFPNGRVLTEMNNKTLLFNDSFQHSLQTHGKDMIFIKDSMLMYGRIDFSESNAQKEPCPEYVLYYPKKIKTYELHFTKCDKTATLTYFNKATQ